MSGPDDPKRTPQSASPAPDFASAVQAMTSGRLAAARADLERLQAAHPQNAVAPRLLAEVAARAGDLGEAEALLRRALALDPAFADARINLASLLLQQNRFADALGEIDQINAPSRDRDRLARLRAAALTRLGRHAEAIATYREALVATPSDPQLQLSLGHLLKAIGDRAGAIACYRTALAIKPGFGAGWWGLANLKVHVFDDADIAAMQHAVETAPLEDALRINFALGKAFEDRGDAAAAFAHYAAGNQARAEQQPYAPGKLEAICRASRALFTPAFLAAHASAAGDAEGPIFIVGMPRSGSTLVEQILASHPSVEGLSELPYIPAMAVSLEQESLGPGKRAQTYPQCLKDVPRERLDRLAAFYLERVDAHRRTTRPWFIDKMPNNWLHVGLMAMILPGARIIDVRRHPLACGLSNFKQHFASGQEYSYGLEQFGHYYRCYGEMMRHWDEVRPGAVERVIYEHLVADPDAEIRRLLAALGLRFDPACLAPHAATRVVATPSAEQVRQPISAAATEHWRAFEPWLGPLKSALGPVLDDWTH
ncbi:MAG: sulfotransferase [Sphingomicrobium sp.]